MTDYIVTIAECPKCGLDQSLDDLQDDGYNRYCVHCDKSYQYDQWEHRERPARYVTLALYYTERAYGGPEEGGWYYDVGTLLPETVRAFDACDFPQIADYKDKLRYRYRDRDPRALRVRTYVEKTAPRAFPSSKPQWS